MKCVPNKRQRHIHKNVRMLVNDDMLNFDTIGIIVSILIILIRFGIMHNIKK